ncbi:carbohydrate binding domain-containing protein [Curtobacterium sp. A7_M15]|uniref:carbohydrate binding domain-containing protein n=1 Tax=Curtobacterium sp. A7_M15 TaxID=3065241 RepID=UPI002737E70E|nr:carbohydrate binding domain-containing protein [Curtobacterium sp. A7_M15]MDP4333551.1 carbohydrate binding domain-containing protein [Curtobacterium sp. A7_M15]
MSSTFTSNQPIHALTHAWLGTANASQSVERKDGVEVRRNLITNPNFETNTTGWSPLQSTLTRVTTEAHSGSAALRMTPTSSGNAGMSLSSQPAISEGDSYTLSLWVKVPADLSREYRVTLWAYDANGVPIGQPSASATTIRYATEWAQISSTYNAPAGAVSLRVQFQSNGGVAASDLLYIDDVLLISGTDTSYFDGSSPTTGELPNIQPVLVTQWAASSQSRHIVHDVLGTPWPAITLQPAGPRTGTMSALFTSELDAADFFTMLRGTAVLTFSDTDTLTTAMQFVATDAIQMAPDSQDSRRWVVTFGYMEVQS